MIRKLFIANRGEIALRIQRAAEKMEVPCVQAFSEIDKEALFVKRCKESVCLGPAPAAESYLNIQKIIEQAKKTECNAIHPGYGFLSENFEFARAVEENGLIFVGPSAESIRKMGSKTLARETVTRAGVPCVPGAQGTDSEIVKASKKVGFPVLIKAVGGGGGRGMRVAYSEKELATLLPLARQESLKNFASDDVFIERFIEKPRHVEVQVFGDKFGNIIHLGTRDCSTQRRHQKLVEEAPAPNLPKAVRDKLHQAAINAAKSVEYYSAGTIEFLVKGSEIFFLEMNTRIQVEHPVTEEITGLDLVEMQLLAANGEKLKVKQKDVKFSGHAIEFRINAEDVAESFRPAIGTLNAIPEASSESGVRIETGFATGDQISPYYDSMISKVIVRAETREDAIAKSFDFLRRYSVQGIPTTIPFHLWLLATENFQDRPVDIHFVEREFEKESLGELENVLYRDPRHRGDLPGYSEFVRIDEKRRIEIVHESGGTFLFIQEGKKGKKMVKRGNQIETGLLQYESKL